MELLNKQKGPIGSPPQLRSAALELTMLQNWKRKPTVGSTEDP